MPDEQPQSQNPVQNCIFCHIISGKVQSKKVYEDSECLAVLDINPANPGHVLLLPKKHYSIMPQMDDLLIGHLFMVSKAMSGALLKALKVEGTNIFVANGAVAGQKAPHFMIHIIPRKEGDGLNFTLPEFRVNVSELLKVRDMLLPRIKANLSLSDFDVQKMIASAPGGEALAQAAAQATAVEQQGQAGAGSGNAAKTGIQSQPAGAQQAAQQAAAQEMQDEQNIDLDAISDILKPITSHAMHPHAGAQATSPTTQIQPGGYSEEHESRNLHMLARDEAEELRERQIEKEEQAEKQRQRKKVTLKDIDELFKGRGK